MSNKFIPPEFPGHHCVGWVKSAHGIRGEIYVQLYAEEADWLDSVSVLYLLMPNEKALKPCKIKRATPHKIGLIVQLEGVADRNHSETLRKSGVYIEASSLISRPGEAIYLKQILGFQVELKDGELVGPIVGFATNGVQDLLRVEYNKQELLIPLVDAFLVNIDFDKRRVKMDLPQGLLNLEEK